MTRIQLIGLASVLLAIVAARGDDKDKPAGDPKDFAKLGQPGAEHERLRGLVGMWTLSADGTKESGTAEYKSILGGRFVTEEVKLPLTGFAIEWVGIYGFDKWKKKYTAVWVDNLDTGTELAEGLAEVSGNLITFKGEHFDPRTGKPSPYVWRITRDGDAKITIEMADISADCKERRVMLVRGVRKK